MSALTPTPDVSQCDRQGREASPMRRRVDQNQTAFGGPLGLGGSLRLGRRPEMKEAASRGGLPHGSWSKVSVLSSVSPWAIEPCGAPTFGPLSIYVHCTST